ncbi:conserved hypothetical protein [Solidesulfovibrio fructosivorans JJ]]|uniref:FAD-binding FR-type domain-containing protein n=1 Tax=Solidesulfovibrio fructosivorans JJ] TaxID=596151 RepID=E1JTH4_SOLFR|nr:conserved hypothetical protein [Solidesulfovibrio fructosivorans JJ]]
MEASVAHLYARLKALRPQPSQPRTDAVPLVQCVDAGSPYCPCYLADLGECLECSVLRGETTCRCRWPGVCVLAHHGWQRGHGTRRQSVRVPVVSRKAYGTLELIRVQVAPQLAAALGQPGSFVFVRGGATPFFDAPVAVVQADPQAATVLLAYAVLGPKTKQLAQCGETVWLRAPYWNGLVGHRALAATRGASCLVVAGGTAQSLAPHVARALLRQGNAVTVVLGRPGPLFSRSFFPEGSAALSLVEMRFPQDAAAFGRLLRRLSPRLVFCAGGERLRGMALAQVATLAEPPRLAWSIDHRMCCGEGVCGACLSNVQGQPVRRCKVVQDA